MDIKNIDYFSNETYHHLPPTPAPFIDAAIIFVSIIIGFILLGVIIIMAKQQQQQQPEQQQQN
ncbi:hypothetical protein DERP_006335 [Dermatophagoides pteronyssinus]|uniref:Uncharacterized protein n=1 Tax=Dermatophagoides pteronyssinus TaxID=6956 RepID=A0ABQ8IYG6_DERPT|nr:hypothetical protein DERP_006335 [Dermatophagoides pteronyssinus]